LPQSRARIQLPVCLSPENVCVLPSPDYQKKEKTLRMAVETLR
jgi:hypothetical protein